MAKLKNRHKHKAFRFSVKRRCGEKTNEFRYRVGSQQSGSSLRTNSWGGANHGIQIPIAAGMSTDSLTVSITIDGEKPILTVVSSKLSIGELRVFLHV